MMNPIDQQVRLNDARHFMTNASPAQCESAADLATATAEALALHEYKGPDQGHTIPGWVYALARQFIEDRETPSI